MSERLTEIQQEFVERIEQIGVKGAGDELAVALALAESERDELEKRCEALVGSVRDLLVVLADEPFWREHRRAVEAALSTFDKGEG